MRTPLNHNFPQKKRGSVRICDACTLNFKTSRVLASTFRTLRAPHYLPMSLHMLPRRYTCCCMCQRTYLCTCCCTCGFAHRCTFPYTCRYTCCYTFKVDDDAFVSFFDLGYVFVDVVLGTVAARHCCAIHLPAQDACNHLSTMTQR